MMSIMELLMYLLGLVVVCCTSFYLFLRKRYKYWEELGVPGPKPQMLFGNLKRVFSLEMTEAELMDIFYNEFPNERFIGIYNLWKPTLLVRDLELIKTICVKDFNNFIDHPQCSSNQGTDALMASLFFLRGEKWRSRRQVLGKTLTPLRLKEYLADFQTSLNVLLKNIDNNVDKDLDIVHMFDRTSIHFLAASYYGMDLSQDEAMTNKFLALEEVFSHPPGSNVCKFLFYTVAPKLHEFLRLRSFPTEIWEFYARLTKGLLESREKEGKGSYFISFLKKLMEEGITENDKVDFTEAVATVFTWFAASHHNTTLTVCHALHQLSCHLDVQKKVKDEVDSVLGDRKSPQFDDLKKFTYLESVITESMRLAAPVGTLKHMCTTEYRLEEGLTIPVGMDINLPVSSLHMDPAHFPDPQVFRPERFLENKTNEAFMGFGKGPRICIGMKYGEMMVKYILSAILKNYSVEISSKMTLPIVFDPRTLFITNRPCNGIWIKFKSRQPAP